MSTIGTWCGRSSSHGVASAEQSAHPAHLTHGASGMSHMSNLGMYRSPMVPLWDHRAQNLVRYGIVHSTPSATVTTLWSQLLSYYPCTSYSEYHCEPLGSVTNSDYEKLRIWAFADTELAVPDSLEKEPKNELTSNSEPN